MTASQQAYKRQRGLGVDVAQCERTGGIAYTMNAAVVLLVLGMVTLPWAMADVADQDDYEERSLPGGLPVSREFLIICIQ